ncbi:MAG: peptidase, partial [Sediminibacterium sp.]|nr:peptidase [Sediminibacterium sp.]
AVMKNKNSFIVPINEKSSSIIQNTIKEEGLKVEETTSIPKDAEIVKSLRIGLWDRYGGSMSSGWLRWILEKHHFDFKLIYANEINEGNLNAKYDAIVFVEGAIPAMTAEAPNPWDEREPDVKDIPAEFHHMVGKITADKSIPSIKQFCN